jgi:branched-chain amino acid transport system substrate-binding protein
VSRKKLEQALKNWQDKRADFEIEFSLTNNQGQKFELRKRIEECNEEIERIKNQLSSDFTEPTTGFNSPHQTSEVAEDRRSEFITPQTGNSQQENSSIFQQRIEKAKPFIIPLVILLLAIPLIFYIRSQLPSKPQEPPNPQKSILPSDTTTIPKFQNQISTGAIILSKESERLLNQVAFDNAKKQGTKAIAHNHYEDGIKALNRTRTASDVAFYKNAPETLIYINNAYIGNDIAYNIAVAAPISQSDNYGLGVLRGVALAQKEINERGILKDVNGKKLLLKIILVDYQSDLDNRYLAEYISSKNITISDVNGNIRILGLIGHQTSDLTLRYGQIYQEAELPVISPSATSAELFGKFNYVHLVAPSTHQMATKLVRLIEHKEHVIVFYDSKEEFSNSFGLQACQAIGKACKLRDLDKSLVTTEEIEQELRTIPSTELVIAFSPAKNSNNTSNKDILSNIIKPVAKFNDKINSVGSILGQKVLFSSNVWYDQTTINKAVDQKVTIVRVSPWDYKFSNVSQDKFLKVSNDTWGTGQVNWYTLMSYNATMSMARAIEQTKSPPPNNDGDLTTIRRKINSEINNGEFKLNGALGEIHFSKEGYVDSGNFICTIKLVTRTNNQPPNCQSSDSIPIK